MKKLQQKANELSVKAYTKAMAFKDNISGSDTTEKIGMVVIAVVIIGLLATAVKTFMPNLFNSIGQTATDTLMNIF